MWVDFWRDLTGDRVNFHPYQSREAAATGISVEDTRRRVQYLEGNQRFQGAHAVFELLAQVPAYAWMAILYARSAVFARISEAIYAFVATHRNACYRISRLLWGKRIERPSYVISARIFARALAVIYAFAFASFGMQVRGLIGSDGILPAGDFLAAVRANYGRVFWRVPTVFWWAHSDFALLSIAWGGFAIALVLTIARRPEGGYAKVAFALLWFYYLSLVMAGQIFMSYQWDLLLLEAGFLTMFLRPALPRIWLFQWLTFRLMFESGLVKIESHDPTWRNLTALAVHYQTQPLPTPLACICFNCRSGFRKHRRPSRLWWNSGCPF